MKKNKQDEPELQPKEKKFSGKQKLALERIHRLYELAEEKHKKNEENYTKRYLGLAKRIGEKMRLSIPKEMQKTFCKKCFSMKITQTKKEPFLEVKCDECDFEKKYSLKEKTNTKS